MKKIILSFTILICLFLTSCNLADIGPNGQQNFHGTFWISKTTMIFDCYDQVVSSTSKSFDKMYIFNQDNLSNPVEVVSLDGGGGFSASIQPGKYLVSYKDDISVTDPNDNFTPRPLVVLSLADNIEFNVKSMQAFEISNCNW